MRLCVWLWGHRASLEHAAVCARPVELQQERGQSNPGCAWCWIYPMLTYRSAACCAWLQRRPTCDFSYAGLKTAVRLAIEEQAPEPTGGCTGVACAAGCNRKAAASGWEALPPCCVR